MQSKDITAEQAIKVSIFGVHGVFSLIHKDLKSQERSEHGTPQYFFSLSNRPNKLLVKHICWVLTNSILTLQAHSLHSIYIALTITKSLMASIQLVLSRWRSKYWFISIFAKWKKTIQFPHYIMLKFSAKKTFSNDSAHLLQAPWKLSILEIKRL